jgi:HEPN domain-containing protein
LRPEVKDWTESSEYDFETAKAMLKAKRYNYCIFMCHQSVEKLLKALIIFLNKEFPPKTHNLIILLEAIDQNPDKEMETIILKLNPHYMVSRYPDAAGGPSHKMYNEQIALEFLKETERVLEWLRQKMK